MSKKERRKERGRKKLTPFKPAMEFGSICLMRKIESFHVSSHAMTMRTNRFDGRSIPSGKMETDARQRASPHDGSINFHQLPSSFRGTAPGKRDQRCHLGRYRAVRIMKLVLRLRLTWIRSVWLGATARTWTFAAFDLRLDFQPIARI